MSFLTGRRIALAADLLLEPARGRLRRPEVGYGELRLETRSSAFAASAPQYPHGDFTISSTPAPTVTSATRRRPDK